MIIDYAALGKIICRKLANGENPETILRFVENDGAGLEWAKGVLAGYMRKREGYVTQAFLPTPKTAKDFFFDRLADDIRAHIKTANDYVDYMLPFGGPDPRKVLRWRAGSMSYPSDAGVLRYVELDSHDRCRSPSERHGSYDRSGLFLDIAILHKGLIIYGITTKDNATKINIPASWDYMFETIGIDFGE